MVLVINPFMLLWSVVTVTGVLIFWSVLRFALTTCDADSVTHGLALLFCLLLLLAGLALGVMFTKVPLG